MARDSLPATSAPACSADGSRRPTRPPTPGRRIRLALLVVAALGLALAAAACSPPVGSGGGLSADTARAVDQDRAANRLAPLARDDQLARLAQSHSQEIATSGSLWHSDLAGWLNSPLMAGWHSLGENLLQGPPGTTAVTAEASWMGSAPHRANILNGGYNRIGVGVAVDGAGRIWMVALFGAR